MTPPKVRPMTVDEVFDPRSSASIPPLGPDDAATLIARVEAGAKLLDRHEAGWFERINRDRLAMTSCDDCILGQLYGTYFHGWMKLVGDNPFRMYMSPSELGFCLNILESTSLLHYSALAAVWRAAIRLRVEAAIAEGGLS